MNYKLIALDLDGTLLDSNEKISEKNIECIKEASKKGVKIIITTGRSYLSAERFIEQIGVPDPVITYNGAIIGNTQNTMKTLTLNDSLISDVINLLKDLDYAPIIYLTDHKKYYQSFGRYSKDFWEFSRGFEKGLIRVEDITGEKWKGVLRISVVADRPDILLLHSEIKHHLGTRVRTVDTFFADWNFWIFEVLHPESSKSKALEYLCNSFHIRREEVIAVGDNNNDLDMISWAGLGVAMRNGLENVIREADYVTEASNNESGVAEVIQRFIFNHPQTFQAYR